MVKIHIKRRLMKKVRMVGAVACISGSAVLGMHLRNVYNDFTSPKVEESMDDIIARNAEKNIDEIAAKPETSVVNQDIKIDTTKEEVKQEVKDPNKSKQQLKAEEYIDYYAKVYNLDEKCVLKTIKKRTDILKKKTLKKLKGKKLEFKILKTVKLMKVKPTKFKLKDSQLHAENYEQTKKIREMVNHYAELYKVDKFKTFAIENWNSEFYTGDLAKVRNNPGGLKRKGEYLIFENLEQGIIAHAEKMTKYRGMTFKQMQSKLCPKSKNWASGVESLYNRDIKGRIKIYDERTE